MKKNTLKKWMGLVTMLFSFSLFAQTINVSGVVTESGMPQTGINIVVKGTTQSTTTGFDGSYTLNNIDSNSVLVFSYIGMKTKEVLVNGQTIVNVVMAPDSQTLSDVVIVGYGSSSKKEVTAAVSSIKGKEIVNTIASNPITALQGKLSGIQVESFGGQPGGSANVFIRGVNSLSNADPLFVVDGLFVKNMDNVNPNDIDDISILKDAAAAAIYGLKSANGVVVITTNHGKKNKAIEIKVNSRIGIETPSKMLEFIDGQQYTNYLNQRFINDKTSTRVTWNGVNTDWQSQSLKSGIIQDNGFTISGGGEHSSFFGSANLFSQSGILVGSGFKRTNMRLNSAHDFGKFKLVQSLGITQGDLQENNWYGFDGTTAPTVALTNPKFLGGYDGVATDIQGPGGVNQFALAKLEQNKRTTTTIFGNAKLDYDITKEITVAASLGVDYSNRRNFQFTPTYQLTDPQNPIGAVRNINLLNDLTEFNQNNTNVLFEPTITYKKDFSGHKISVLLGSSYFREAQNSIGIYGQGTPNNNIKVVSALPSNATNILLGTNDIGVLISYFGRLNYGYKNRYLFSGTIRRDASSRFEERNKQIAYFPSISGAWNVTSEDFWSKSGFVNALKLRASYGKLGSTVDEFYPAEGPFNPSSGTSFGGAFQNGIAQTVLVDDNLTWETTSTIDFGLDASFLNNKINLSADYYSKNIDNVLVTINLPSTAGVSAPTRTNAGSLLNRGLEFSADFRKTEGDFKFKVGANVSFNLENIAKDIPNPILGPGIDEDLRVVNSTRTGQPIGGFYGYKVEDKVNPATGNFVRIDTNNDGVITADDITLIGDPTPDFTYGLNFSGEYKNVDFAFNFNGVQGNEIYNLSRYYNILWRDGGKLSDVLNSWTPTNTNTNIPQATIGDAAGNKAPSSFFVEDGSYLRLKNIEMGYNFKKGAFGVDWIKNMRLSFNVQNVFVITKYSGYDPDVASTNGGRANLNSGVPGLRPQVNSLLGRGLDARAYPNARTYSFGVQVTF
jgi:TonB-dependent starch-binding outer membrane protein SusC